MVMGFKVPQDTLDTPQDTLETQFSIPVEPPKRQVERHLTMKKINGNIVIVTAGIGGDDFTIFPIGVPINTSGRDSKETLPLIKEKVQTDTMFGDKTATIFIGCCVVLLSMCLTALVVGSGKQSQPIPYQPTPYTIETEDCEPSGFLWMGKACKSRIERGIR